MRERIIEIRKYYKKSQTAFADDIGVSRNFINLYENGNRELSERTISDICRIYNVSESWLRTGKGNMFNPLDREQEVAQVSKRLLKADEYDDLANIIKNLGQLSDEDWKELNRIIKKLLKDQEKDSSEN